MTSRWFVVFVIGLVLCFGHVYAQEQEPTTIHDGVVQVELPDEDVTLHWFESRGGMTIQLETQKATVQAQRMYLGDGKVAVELVADHPDEIRFQGQSTVKHGHKFLNRSVIQVQPGYKKAVELKPGDVYVILPGIRFELPKK